MANPEYLEKALHYARNAVELKNDGNYIDTLGWIYFKMNRHSDAVKYLKQAYELEPHDMEIHAHLQEAQNVLKKTDSQGIEPQGKDHGT